MDLIPQEDPAVCIIQAGYCSRMETTWAVTLTEGSQEHIVPHQPHVHLQPQLLRKKGHQDQM